MTDKPHTEEAEATSLDAVRDAQAELAHGLNSLGGKEMDGVERYIGFLASHLNKAATGYIVLRESHRVDCSKLLVRPITEFMLRLCAIEISRV